MEFNFTCSAIFFNFAPYVANKLQDHGLDPSLGYLLGVIASIGVICFVLLHELAHALVSKYLYRQAVHSITLFALGGLTRTDIKKGEAVIAFAGPLSSLALGGIFIGIKILFPSLDLGPAYLIKYFIFINIALAVSNMLPILPLDGGRVFLGVFGSLLRNEYRALHAIQFFGYIAMLGIISFAVWQISLGNIFGGLWIVIILGWIFVAGQQELQKRLNAARKD